MSYVDRPQHEPRPVDRLWPDRREALASQQCSIGHHPVSTEEIESWSKRDQSEYYISGCCPTCWDEMFGEDDD